MRTTVYKMPTSWTRLVPSVSRPGIMSSRRCTHELPNDRYPSLRRLLRRVFRPSLPPTILLNIGSPTVGQVLGNRPFP